MQSLMERRQEIYFFYREKGYKSRRFLEKLHQGSCLQPCQTDLNSGMAKKGEVEYIFKQTEGVLGCAQRTQMVGKRREVRLPVVGSHKSSSEVSSVTSGILECI